MDVYKNMGVYKRENGFSIKLCDDCPKSCVVYKRMTT